MLSVQPVAGEGGRCALPSAALHGDEFSPGALNALAPAEP